MQLKTKKMKSAHFRPELNAIEGRSNRHYLQLKRQS